MLYSYFVKRLIRQSFDHVNNHRWQGYRTVAGMVAVVTSVLAGSTAALLAIVLSDHSLAAALIAGGLVSVSVVVALMRFQDSVWKRASAEPLIADEGEGPS